MKRILLALLCLSLLLAACSKKKTPSEPSASQTVTQSEAPSEPLSPAQLTQTPATEASEEPPATESGIAYRSLSGASTVEDMEAAEGRAPDFSFESNGTTVYAYNDVTLPDGLFFTQVQFSFQPDYVRVSCTYTAQENLDTVRGEWCAVMDGRYGASAAGNTQTWSDAHGSYAMLTQLNDTTLQLAFYLVP